MAYHKNTVNLEKMLLKFLGEPDPMLSMLEWLCHKMMEVEVENKLNAGKGEHSPNRTGYRSGTRVRRFDTRMGTIYLLIPKVRKGGYVPFFVTEKKRSEQALIQVVQEAFINGVSTRKIERLARSLGIESISPSQVSQINKELTQQVEEFRNRPLADTYPVIWIDALYEKIRDNHRVCNMAVHVVCGVNLEGKREVLAVEPMYEESEASYTALFTGLKKRGLKNVWLAVSDAHQGLVSAIKKSFVGCSWQRCKVHFMRNILVHVPAKDKESFAAKLKQIWQQPDYESAKRYAELLIEEYEARFPKAVEVLANGLEDSLQFYGFPEIDAKKISSTNMLERLHKEIRRRSKVVGIFPSMDSYIRLISCYLIEYAEDWETSKCYIRKEILQHILARRNAA
ncbi:MAG: IS256 family transposase [Dethiobacteraceae bacterium]|jgi:putative transposase|nr:IS256 family transposase [Acetomicrobium sp.]